MMLGLGLRPMTTGLGPVRHGLGLGLEIVALALALKVMALALNWACMSDSLLETLMYLKCNSDVRQHGTSICICVMRSI